jgi:hypothetical protein
MIDIPPDHQIAAEFGASPPIAAAGGLAADEGIWE